MLNKKYGKSGRSVLIILLLTAAIGMSVMTDIVSGADSDIIYEVPDDILDFEYDSQYEELGDVLSVKNGPMDCNFDGNTTQYLGLPQAVPINFINVYTIWGDWGGTWEDAEKSWWNTEDDLMCWAATASNILEFTGWGKVGGMTDTGQMFGYFQDHWTDKGGWMYHGWKWWFDGSQATGGTSRVDVAGGNFWPGYSFSSYYKAYWGITQALQKINSYMRAGYGSS